MITQIEKREYLDNDGLRLSRDKESQRQTDVVWGQQMTAMLCYATGEIRRTKAVQSSVFDGICDDVGYWAQDDTPIIGSRRVLQAVYGLRIGSVLGPAGSYWTGCGPGLGEKKGKSGVMGDNNLLLIERTELTLTQEWNACKWNAQLGSQPR
jgi:hypothetical protein